LQKHVQIQTVKNNKSLLNNARYTMTAAQWSQLLLFRGCENYNQNTNGPITLRVESGFNCLLSF